MNDSITLRAALKLIATSTVVGAAFETKTAANAIAPASTPDAKPADAWSRTHERVWLATSRN